MNKFLLAILLLLPGGAALAYEQPRYDVISHLEGFEVRRYQPYIVAEIIVNGEFQKVGNEGFRALAGYIFGKNRSRQEIAMTAPVNQSLAKESGEKIAMTVPVIQAPATGVTGSYAISFMMPSVYTLETLPEPLDPRIRFRRIDARMVAARTYSGLWSERRFRDNEAALRRGMMNANLRAVGEAIWARYNPPITPWFLRRNEVLIQIEPTDAINQPPDSTK